MDIQTTIAILGAPAIYAVVEAVKATGINPKYLPLISVGIGSVVGIALGFAYADNVVVSALIGLAVGAVPVASHEAIKNLSATKK